MSRAYYVRVLVGAALVAAAALSPRSAGQDRKPAAAPKLEGHRGGVTAIAFGPRGNVIATGAGNGVVRLWDAKTGELIAKMNDHAGESITGLAFSPDGGLLAGSGKGAVVLWDLALKDGAGAPKGTPIGSDGEARYADVSISGDGTEVCCVKRLRSPSYPGYLLRFNKPQGTHSRYEDLRNFDPRAVACVPDAESRLAAVYGECGEKAAPAVILFGLGDTKVVTRGVPPPAKDAPQRVHFSPDGKWLGVCSGATFAVWRVPGSQIIGGDPVTVGGDVYAAALGPGDRAATVEPPSESQDLDVILWKLGPEPKRVAAHPTGFRDVRCLAFSPDGATLAVGGYIDGAVHLWALDQ
jgi:WD40 repeat protein